MKKELPNPADFALDMKKLLEKQRPVASAGAPVIQHKGIQMQKKTPNALDRIADKVLSYRAPARTTKAKRRRRKAAQ